MIIKAKISAVLMLLLVLGQLSDASLFPHTHFTGGKFISRVYDLSVPQAEKGKSSENAAYPETCPAQRLMMALMSVSLLSGGQFEVEAPTLHHRSGYAGAFTESYRQRFEACCNNFRGPPSLV